MKSKIIALALFAFTAAAVAFYPYQQGMGTPDPTSDNQSLVPTLTQGQSRIDVVFALDTTGSMGGLIAAAKEKIWSIASSMAAAQPAPEIRMGLVAYRDRGDDYVTHVLDLSADLDSMYSTLMDLQAAGGGDGPESVNQALHDAVHKMSWSQDPQAYKVVFLVGDAPPHMDYQDDVKYPETLTTAVSRGIVINTVQCGENQRTTEDWKRIAQTGDGRYFQVGQSGSAIAIATPFDKKLAKLSRELDETRLYYGNPEEKKMQQAKLDATDKLHKASSLESRARRAAFNASKSGKANFLGKGELVDDVASGRVELSEIKPQELPEPLQSMTQEQQSQLISQTAEHRNELQRQIKELADQRADYLKKRVDESGEAKDSLDQKIYSAVREQAAVKGLHYEAEAAAY